MFAYGYASSCDKHIDRLHRYSFVVYDQVVSRLAADVLHMQTLVLDTLRLNFRKAIVMFMSAANLNPGCVLVCCSWQPLTVLAVFQICTLQCLLH